MWRSASCGRLGTATPNLNLPYLTPHPLVLSVNAQADLPQVAFRRLRQAWIDRGNYVDPEQTQLHSGSLDM